MALLAGPRHEASSHRLVTNKVIDAAQFDARSEKGFRGSRYGFAYIPVVSVVSARITRESLYRAVRPSVRILLISRFQWSPKDRSIDRKLRRVYT